MKWSLILYGTADNPADQNNLFNSHSSSDNDHEKRTPTAGHKTKQVKQTHERLNKPQVDLDSDLEDHIIDNAKIEEHQNHQRQQQQHNYHKNGDTNNTNNTERPRFDENAQNLSRDWASMTYSSSSPTQHRCNWALSILLFVLIGAQLQSAIISATTKRYNKPIYCMQH